MNYLQKTVKFEGLTAYDGYFYRKPDALWFHACDGQCEDMLAVDFTRFGDNFSLMPEELLRKADYWDHIPKDWYQRMRTRVRVLVEDERNIQKLFFPRGVHRSITPEHDRKFTFSYYAISEVVMEQWGQTGTVTDRAWEALAYSAYMQCYATWRKLIPSIDPWLGPTYFRQIKLAKSHEERARVIEIIRPRPAGEKIYVRNVLNHSSGLPLQLVAA